MLSDHLEYLGRTHAFDVVQIVTTTHDTSCNEHSPIESLDTAISLVIADDVEYFDLLAVATWVQLEDYGFAPECQ